MWSTILCRLMLIVWFLPMYIFRPFIAPFIPSWLLFLFTNDLPIRLLSALIRMGLSLS